MRRVLTTLLMLTFGHGAMADGGGLGNFGLGVQAGTTGAGAVFAAGLTDSLNVRAHYNVFTYDTDFNQSEINYQADFNKDNFGVLLDWHPFGGGFRFSGGLYVHSDNTIDVVAVPSAAATYVINGVTYNVSDIGSVVGEVGFGKSTPYLGIGFGNMASGKGLSFLVDVGVQFQDSPDVNLTTVTCNLTLALCDQLTTDLQTEVLAVEADAEDYDMWPVINLGLIWKF